MAIPQKFDADARPIPQAAQADEHVPADSTRAPQPAAAPGERKPGRRGGADADPESGAAA